MTIPLSSLHFHHWPQVSSDHTNSPFRRKPQVSCHPHQYKETSAQPPGAGAPNPQATDGYWSVAHQEPGSTAGGERRASEHSHYRLNSTSFLQPPPTLFVEKLSSTKPVPGAKKVGDLYILRSYHILSNRNEH